MLLDCIAINGPPNYASQSELIVFKRGIWGTGAGMWWDWSGKDGVLDGEKAALGGEVGVLRVGFLGTLAPASLSGESGVLYPPFAFNMLMFIHGCKRSCGDYKRIAWTQKWAALEGLRYAS